jgi:hypothetical protein
VPAGTQPLPYPGADVKFTADRDRVCR